MLSISENTLRDQCQAGTRDAMCFAGKLWLVRLPKANVTLDTQFYVFYINTDMKDYLKQIKAKEVARREDLNVNYLWSIAMMFGTFALLLGILAR